MKRFDVWLDIMFDVTIVFTSAIRLCSTVLNNWMWGNIGGFCGWLVMRVDYSCFLF